MPPGVRQNDVVLPRFALLSGAACAPAPLQQHFVASQAPNFFFSPYHLRTAATIALLACVLAQVAAGYIFRDRAHGLRQ